LAIKGKVIIKYLAVTFFVSVLDGKHGSGDSYFPLVSTVKMYGYALFGVQQPRYAEYYKNLGHLDWLSYSLDDGDPYPFSQTLPPELSQGYVAIGSVVLTNVPDGIHTVTVQGQTTLNMSNYNLSQEFSANITFTKNTGPVPTLTSSPLPSIGVSSVDNLALRCFSSFSRNSFQKQRKKVNQNLS
jgi:hypothetical protein